MRLTELRDLIIKAIDAGFTEVSELKEVIEMLKGNK